MRLLTHDEKGKLVLRSFNNDTIPDYAILSHTWLVDNSHEVSIQDLQAGTAEEKPGYAKIRFCERQAVADRLQYFWIDTCCIDKSSSNELSTAINSMFSYYQRASKCYVYLSDVHVPEEVTDVLAFRITWEGAFQRSRWFTRGWTLQELIAPATAEFFSNEGRRLGSKISLELEIHDITKVPVEALRGQHLSHFSVEERMEWMEKRVTTIKEDRAYCLLGIFSVFMPLIYGEGEDYAFLRLRDEIQKRQEGRGTERLRDLAVSSSLPFPRNESFIGREDQLKSLEKLLFAPRTHRRMTVYGLGGCGKSALALEFAYRVKVKDASYQVFWVPAISQESFELAYREIGILLRIPGITDDNADVKQLIKKVLSAGSSGNWLMIVDNADDTVLLDAINKNNTDQRFNRLIDFLPSSDRGTIIFTTRSGKIAESLTQKNVIKLDDMNQTEARELVVQRLLEKSTLDDEAAIDELLGLLSYLPLAIVQAAAFINSNGVSISDYISLFSVPSMEIQLFSEHFEDPSRYQEAESTIAKTWHISFDQILKQDPLAADYLSFMACIDRVDIPQSLLPLAASQLQQTKAIGTLKGYAFLTERQQVQHQPQGEKFFDIHRLVHIASVWWLKEHGEWTTWTSKAADRLKEVVPYGGHERKERWTAYLSHAMHVAGLDETLDATIRALLLDQIGRCQASLGRYLVAETAHRQALSLRKNSLGKEHVLTLTSMNEIGVVSIHQGKYEAAELIHRQTLAVYEKVLGPDHPDTLQSRNNLAAVLGRRGEDEEAEAMHRQTLAAREKVLGPEHPDTLLSINNLAAVLGQRGKDEEAEAMHWQTLAVHEKVLGPSHPNTLQSKNNLATVLGRRGIYDQAEAMHRQTLAAREKVLGSNHPDTLQSRNNLAGVLSQRGNNEEAEAMHWQTLAVQEKVLGPDHPNTLLSRSNLAGVLGRRGMYEEAEAMHRQILTAQEKLLGLDHPDTLQSRNNLAEALGWLGKGEDAEAMHRETLVTREKVLGPEHPDTLLSTNNLAAVLGQRGKDEEAEAMHWQTLAVQEKVLGPDHPNTLLSRSNLAGVLGRRGKDEEAEAMHRQTLAVKERVLGPDHPDTLGSIYSLAHLLAYQRHYGEANALYKRACAGYSAVLGDNHPSTRSCRRQYSDMLVSEEEQSRYAEFPDRYQVPDGPNASEDGSIPGVEISRRSRMVRGLAKIGIGLPKFS